MNTLSDEEFEQIYGRKPVRRVKKKKIYWNRIIIALIILIGIVTGLVKLTALVVSKIKGDDTQKTNKVLNNTSSVAVKEDASSAEDKKDEPAKYSNMNFTVCVDAGHGDYDGGTTDASGKRYEKDDNLKVALEVQKYLEKYGVNVVMIRDDDSFLELDERCAKANNAKADMYVSLHRNSYDGDISGVEVWVNNSEPEYDTKLAQNILDDLEKVGISENRGVQYGYVGNSGVNYYINADTVMPSCLVELGFITEDIDNKLFDEHLTEYGQAIADGIVQTAIDVGLVDESGKRLMSEQLLIPMAAALHDIGKIGIDDKILNKPGRLTKEEFEIMKTHSAIGANMLESLEQFRDEPLLKIAHDICRWHHERYDGRGYPDGLKGDEIPISAQIVSVADVYDALVSERVYKKAYSHEKAMALILNGECGTFNPVLVECLKDIQNELAKGVE